MRELEQRLTKLFRVQVGYSVVFCLMTGVYVLVYPVCTHPVTKLIAVILIAVFSLLFVASVFLATRIRRMLISVRNN